ncbi:hypothetical protein JTB14_036594 [Gonioctena quinquepunctata]|nr:hypothetical protein JTB14_036594 [Gonioctena quinquepunctata]
MKTVDISSSANTEDICVMSGMEGIGNGSSIPNIQDGSAATTEEEAVTDLSSWDHISIVDEEIDQFDRPMRNTRGQLPKRLEDFELTFFSDTFINSSNPQSYYEAMSAEFDVKYLGTVTSCLGMTVSRNRSQGQLILSQTEYTKNLLKSFGMSESKPISTPMCLNTKLVKPNEIDVLSDDKYQFRRLIGGLMYLSVCTRPDIAFACSQLSQFNSCYDQSHWTAAKRVLRYLAGTKDYGLIFEKADNQKIEAFTDADWANDSLDRKMYTGFVVKMGDSTINWEARKQRSIALSSTEAECLAIGDVAKEVCFVRHLMNEINGMQDQIVIYNDNQSAHRIIENTHHHRRTKHIDVRHHYIRDLVQNKVVVIKYREKNDMVADILTKPLSKEKHQRYRKMMNIESFEDIRVRGSVRSYYTD